MVVIGGSKLDFLNQNSSARENNRAIGGRDVVIPDRPKSESASTPVVDRSVIQRQQAPTQSRAISTASPIASSSGSLVVPTIGSGPSSASKALVPPSSPPKLPAPIAMLNSPSSPSSYLPDYAMPNGVSEPNQPAASPAGLNLTGSRIVLPVKLYDQTAFSDKVQNTTISRGGCSITSLAIAARYLNPGGMTLPPKLNRDYPGSVGSKITPDPRHIAALTKYVPGSFSGSQGNTSTIPKLAAAIPSIKVTYHGDTVPNGIDGATKATASELLNQVELGLRSGKVAIVGSDRMPRPGGGTSDHYSALNGIDKEKQLIYMADPSGGLRKSLTFAQFKNMNPVVYIISRSDDDNRLAYEGGKQP